MQRILVWPKSRTKIGLITLEHSINKPFTYLVIVQTGLIKHKYELKKDARKIELNVPFQQYDQ